MSKRTKFVGFSAASVVLATSMAQPAGAGDQSAEKPEIRTTVMKGAELRAAAA